MPAPNTTIDGNSPIRWAKQITNGNADSLAEGAGRGIHANTDGNVVGVLIDGDSDVTLAVIAGVNYRYRFKSISASTSADIAVLY